MRDGQQVSSHTPQRWLSGSRTWLGPLIVISAALVATAPLRVFAFSCGNDFDFHLVSWIDALHSWREGILYPQWAPSANYGTGEPRFLFYPPLTWMLGAALGAVMDWRHVPFLLTFILLCGVGLAVRALARQALGEGPATLAGCLAVCSGYTLFTVYQRSAYAELAGGFWIPLLLLFMLKERRTAETERPTSRFWQIFGGATLPLALGLAGAWLSNAPVGVMASYLLAAAALTVAVMKRSWIPAVRAAVGAGLGLGLASFYLVPAAWEQKWVDIRQATDDPGLLIQNSFLFGRHANPTLEQHDVELFRVSCVAVAMIALPFLGLLIATLRGRLPGGRPWWVPLALIPLAVLILQLPISLPIWDTLPKLRFLQFPWRWLVVTEAPMAIFVAAAVWTERPRPRALVATMMGLLCVGSAAFAGVGFFQGCAPEDSVPSMISNYREGVGFEGTDEYAPPNADDSLVATDLPASCLVADPEVKLGGGDPDLTPNWAPDQKSCEATFPFVWAPGTDDVEHKRVHATLPHAGFLVLKLRDYPAWQVQVNGTAVPRGPERLDGLIDVAVPAGRVDLTVDWTATPDVRIGRYLSLAAVLIVTGLGTAMWRSSQSRLK